MCVLISGCGGDEVEFEKMGFCGGRVRGILI